MTKQLKEANEHIQFLSKFANQETPRKGKNSNKNELEKIIQNNNKNEMMEKLTDAKLNKFFNEYDSKMNYISTLNKNYENDKDCIIQRLIKSVNMVKEVLQANLKLRIQNQDLNKDIDNLKAENYHLFTETDRLNEKVRVINEIDNKNSLQINDGTSSFLTFKTQIAEEVINLKKEKKNLEERVFYLEKENIRIRAKKGTNSESNTDFEPVRSLINAADLPNNKYKEQKLSFHSDLERINIEKRILSSHCPPVKILISNQNASEVKDKNLISKSKGRKLVNPFESSILNHCSNNTNKARQKKCRSIYRRVGNYNKSIESSNGELDEHTEANVLRKNLQTAENKNRAFYNESKDDIKYEFFQSKMNLMSDKFDLPPNSNHGNVFRVSQERTISKHNYEK